MRLVPFQGLRTLHSAGPINSTQALTGLTRAFKCAVDAPAPDSQLTRVVLSTGCQWQALPKDLPPKSTAHSYFMLWDWDGTLERVHHALYVATREREGREASPTAAIIDSQSAKAAQKGAPRLTRRALMRPRRSPAANGISWSTRSACC